ncbi:endocuticle structural glycoprotein SgAbd-9-like [Uloborus diversus]|uniref:endocuticle structural glycoprotein SgAbd-9-like n=1 Tax=Uloborus diversus TaxID=327109 RepID=UPI002409BB69|nr:endocuticle structural glycoprotein SgAbd-9-like [Uloborus diversus]
MKFVVATFLCLIAVVHCEIDYKIEDDGKYSFKYNTEDAGSHQREESSNGDGIVSGSFSYLDANGDLRKTTYTAGKDGFQPSGDIGVDKKTAEKAAELAALAPKAPVEEKTEVNLHSSPFTLPFYALPGLHAPVYTSHHHYPYAIPSPLHHPFSYVHYAHW